MTTYQEALDQVLEAVSPLETTETPLAKSIGLVLGEDVYSDLSLPELDVSGPDGYAVRLEDIEKASRDNPVVLRIAGTVRAGRLPQGPVRPGTAVRIMTGSTVPPGADCVVPFESTDEPGNKSGPNPEGPSHVRIFHAEGPGANIRPAGSNISKGQLVLPRGVSIGPAQISALAAIGTTSIKVIRRPVVAIISTGDELVRLGRSLKPGKCYDCNSEAIASLVAHYGGIPRVIGVARDNEESLATRIRQARGADAIVTSGGVSKGDYDLVRLVLEKMGRVVLSRINMGPGASFAFGLMDRISGDSGTDSVPTDSIPVFALSGPPVGCLINFETLVRPALLKMMGFGALSHPTVEAVAEDAAGGKKPMAFVKWTRLEDDRSHQRVVMNLADSLGPLCAMAKANSLVIIAEGTEVRKGDKIQVLPLDWTRD